MLVVGQVFRAPFKLLDALRQPATGKTLLVTVRDPTGAVRVNEDTATEIDNGDYDYPILLDKEGVWLVDGDCVEINFHETRVLIVGSAKPAKVNAYFPQYRKYTNDTAVLHLGGFTYIYYSSYGDPRLEMLTYPDLTRVNSYNYDGSVGSPAFVTDGTYLYVIVWFGEYGFKVHQIDPITLSIIQSWSSPTTTCYGGALTTDGTYLYCAYRDYDEGVSFDRVHVVKIETSGMTTVSTWDGPDDRNTGYGAITYSDGFVYFAQWEDDESSYRLISIDVSSMTTSDSSDDLWYIFSLLADSNYLYVGVSAKNYGDDAIMKIDPSTLEIDESWISDNPDDYLTVVSLALDEGFLYAAMSYPPRIVKFSADSLDFITSWQGDDWEDEYPSELGLAATEDYLIYGVDPAGVYLIPKRTLVSPENFAAIPDGEQNLTIAHVLGNKEDEPQYSIGNYSSLMSYVKGLLNPPVQQADAVLQQSSPAQLSYYSILNSSGKFNIQSISVRVGSIGETLQVEIQTNSGTYYCSASCAADTDYVVHKQLGVGGTTSGMRFTLDAATNLPTEDAILPTGMPLNSCYIAVTKTTNNGSGTLWGRISYTQPDSY